MLRGRVMKKIAEKLVMVVESDILHNSLKVLDNEVAAGGTPYFLHNFRLTGHCIFSPRSCSRARRGPPSTTIS
jgi:hypothetical protein